MEREGFRFEPATPPIGGLGAPSLDHMVSQLTGHVHSPVTHVSHDNYLPLHECSRNIGDEVATHSSHQRSTLSKSQKNRQTRTLAAKLRRSQRRIQQRCTRRQQYRSWKQAVIHASQSSHSSSSDPQLRMPLDEHTQVVHTFTHGAGETRGTHMFDIDRPSYGLVSYPEDNPIDPHSSNFSKHVYPTPPPKLPTHHKQPRSNRRPSNSHTHRRSHLLPPPLPSNFHTEATATS